MLETFEKAVNERLFYGVACAYGEELRDHLAIFGVVAALTC